MDFFKKKKGGNQKKLKKKKKKAEIKEKMENFIHKNSLEILQKHVVEHSQNGFEILQDFWRYLHCKKINIKCEENFKVFQNQVKNTSHF